MGLGRGIIFILLKYIPPNSSSHGIFSYFLADSIIDIAFHKLDPNKENNCNKILIAIIDNDILTKPPRPKRGYEVILIVFVSQVDRECAAVSFAGVAASM